MMLYRDYNIMDDISVRPLSVGINSYCTKENDTLFAGYISCALLSYRDVVRVEGGVSVTWNDNKDRLEGALLTGISTLIKERIIVGIWMSPFWNLVGSKDDAYGGMIGYAFSL